MGISAGVGAVIAAVIGAGSAVYSADQQKKTAKKGRDAQMMSELEARRIEASKAPLEETATLKTNVDSAYATNNENVLNALSLLNEPTKAKKTGLGASLTSTGLGFGG